MKIDEHEFIAKMEGFALQALKGMHSIEIWTHINQITLGITSNYKQEVSTHRTAIRAEINKQLRKYQD